MASYTHGGASAALHKLNMNECVYYWVGGSMSGHWNKAVTEQYGQSVRPLIESLERQGYVALKGSSAIGPPEGPPAEEHFTRVRAIVDQRIRGF